MSKIEITTICKSERYYQAFPHIIREGKILHLYFSRSSFHDHYVVDKVVSMNSNDEGETWKHIEESSNGPRYQLDSWRTREYEIGGEGFFVRSDVWTKKEKNKYLIWAKYPWNKKEIIVAGNKLYFSGRGNVHTIPVVFMDAFFTFPRAYEDVDTLYVPAYGIDKSWNKRGNVPFLIKVKKQSGQFSLIDMFPSYSFGMNEYAVIKHKGFLCAFLRSDKRMELFYSYSKNDGETWSYPIALYSPTIAPIHIMQWEKDIFLLTYGRRVYGKEAIVVALINMKDPTDPFSLMKKLTEKTLTSKCGFPSNLYTNKSDKKVKERGLYDFGYPVTVKVKGGFLTVYYCTREDGITYIEQAKWDNSLWNEKAN